MLVKTMTLWEIGVQDQQKLRAMQHKIADIKHSWNTPEVVLGFAMTTGWETAEAKFRTMIKWRLDNDVDSLLANYKPNRLMLDNSPIAFLKDYDRDGDPIYLERGGAIDVRGMLNRFSREEMMRHAIWLREVHANGDWVYEYERRQGRECRQVTVVYDLAGLNRQHLNPTVLGFFGELMQITEDYYPGPIKRMIIIRAPHVFRFVWKVVKNFFSQESQDKMIFADSDYLSVLDQYMDIDVLPSCINPKGHGETAIGMPSLMDCKPIPDYVGPGGANYVGVGSGINEVPSCNGGKVNKHQTNETGSQCSSTQEDDSSSSGEEEEVYPHSVIEGLSSVTLSS